MPVPTTFADLSTTPASNSPAGSENVFPSLDDYIRFINAALASIKDNTATNGWVSPYIAGTGSWAIPGPIGSTTPNTGAFTTLTATDGSGIAALSASNLGSGTVPNARFPATLPAVSGANLTNLTTANLATGTLPAGVTVPAAQLSGSIPSAVSATTQAIGANSTLVATTAYAYAQAFGGATWQEVGGSRSKGVTYTNSTGRAIGVNVEAQAGGNGARMRMTMDGIDVIGPVSQGGGNRFGSFWLVPPGGTYLLRDEFETNTVISWQELRT